MGYDPSTYERAPVEDKNTSNDTRGNDDPSSISPKIVFVIVGLLVGVAIGYGIAQLLTESPETITVEVPASMSISNTSGQTSSEFPQVIHPSSIQTLFIAIAKYQFTGSTFLTS